MRPIGSPAELERRRHLAVQRVTGGYDVPEVADFLGVDPSSVRRWLTACRHEGPAALASRPATGRPPKLTATQEKVVRRWLGENPIDHGFATELWTAPRLGWLIQEEFGVHFHPNYLVAWLRRRGYTPQLPRRRPRERDDAAIARWLAQDWPRIKRQARSRRACLIFMDESGLLMAPLRRRSWAPQGRPSPINQKGRHREKVSVAGALWLTPGRDRLALAFETIIDGYYDSAAVAEFLGGAVQWLQGPAIVIWDGGSMHKGGPLTELVRESKGRLALEPLPAYASELMPMEQAWTWLKYDRLCNFAPANAHDLNAAIVRELAAIRDDQRRLRNFFHASKLPLPRALLT